MNREDKRSVLRAWSPYRCRIRKDECGDEMVFGKHGLIREYSAQLRLIYMPRQKDHNRDNYRVPWENRRDKLVAAGCALLIDAHGEGVVLFDPQNGEQSLIAIEVAGVRQKRRFDPERMKELAARGRAALQAKIAQQEAIVS